MEHSLVLVVGVVVDVVVVDVFDVDFVVDVGYVQKNPPLLYWHVNVLPLPQFWQSPHHWPPLRVGHCAW